MGGGAVGDNDGGLDAKIIGAIIGTALAVGTALKVLCTSSDSRKEQTRGRARGQHNTEASSNMLMTTFKESVPCVNISKKMAKCLEGNGYDIKKCVVYFDLLKDAEKPVMNEAEKSKMKEAEKPRRTD